MKQLYEAILWSNFMKQIYEVSFMRTPSKIYESYQLYQCKTFRILLNYQLSDVQSRYQTYNYQCFHLTVIVRNHCTPQGSTSRAVDSHFWHNSAVWSHFAVADYTALDSGPWPLSYLSSLSSHSLSPQSTSQKAMAPQAWVAPHYPLKVPLTRTWPFKLQNLPLITPLTNNYSSHSSKTLEKFKITTIS